MRTEKPNEMILESCIAEMEACVLLRLASSCDCQGFDFLVEHFVRFSLVVRRFQACSMSIAHTRNDSFPSTCTVIGICDARFKESRSIRSVAVKIVY